MKESEVSRLVQMLKAAYPRQPLPTDTLAVYSAFLSDLEREPGEEAVRTAIATLKFFPTIAEIRELATARRVSLPNTTDAWGEVLRVVGSTGRYRLPKFTHPAIARVVDAMGWIVVCDSDNQEATRAHFLRLYVDTSETVLHEVNVVPVLDAARERRQLRKGGVVPIANVLKLPEQAS